MSRLPVGLSLALLLVACNSSPSQNPPDETRVPTNIDSFDAFPNPVNIGTQFTWTVFGSNLRCTIDADSNGTIDYTVDNCTSSSRVNHVYPTNGQYIATLYLSGADGLTDQELAIVKVLEANRSPNIVQLRHQPVTSNPLSLAFGWSVDDADQHITQCQLDADSDGQIDFNDLCSKLGHTYTFAKRGKYTALLRACDPYSCVERKLPVRVPYNTPPVIEMLKGVAGNDRAGEVSFVVSDADDDTLQCKLQVSTIGTFTFNNCTEALRKYKFAEDGSYPVTLKVTDGINEVSKSVTIKFGGGSEEPEPPLPPLPVCDYSTPPGMLSKYGGQDVTSLAWSPDGSLLVSSQYDGDQTVTVWNTSARPLGDFSKHKEIDERPTVNDFLGLALSPTGQYLGVATYTGEIWFWDVTTPASPVEINPSSRLAAHTPGQLPQSPLKSYYVVMAWSSQNVLVSGSLDGSLKLWNVANPATASQIGADLANNGAVRAVAFTRSGRKLATAGDDDAATIKLWDVSPTGATLNKVLVAQTNDILGIAWSPMADRLAAADTSGVVKVWDVASGNQVGGSILHGSDRAEAVTFSPDGSILATTGFNSVIRLWKFDSSNSQWIQVGSDVVGAGDRNYDLEFSPDGKYLATGDENEDVRIWNFEASCTGP